MSIFSSLVLLTWAGFGVPDAAAQNPEPDESQHPVPFHSDMPPPIYPTLTLRQTAYESRIEPLWPLVRNAFQLERQLDNPRVQQELAWLRKHADFVQRLAPRMKRYAPYIFRELDRRKMPGELLFLAMIESALDPFAFSPGGAAGLWQFMPATAKRFSLKIDWWVDERRDPVLATNAALDYLELLYRRFDSWELAIAAYNAGEGRISKAVRRAGSKEFSKLRIPRETAGYLPRLLAWAEAFKNPLTYGLRLPEVNARVAQRQIETGSQLDLSQAAKALEVSLAELYDWNPALNQWATHPDGPHRLLVGKTSVDPQLSLDLLPADNRLSWRRHQVKRGETLSTLAEQYHTDVAVLLRANELDSHQIRTGQTLMIPSGADLDGEEGVLPTRRRSSAGGVVKQINYQVRRGDSLSVIAARFNVTTRQILGWNGLDLAKYLHPGQKLRLYVDLTVAQ